MNTHTYVHTYVILHGPTINKITIQLNIQQTEEKLVSSTHYFILTKQKDEVSNNSDSLTTNIVNYFYLFI